jgi:hypothetical protein
MFYILLTTVSAVAAWIATFAALIIASLCPDDLICTPLGRTAPISTWSAEAIVVFSAVHVLIAGLAVGLGIAMLWPFRWGVRIAAGLTPILVLFPSVLFYLSTT